MKEFSEEEKQWRSSLRGAPAKKRVTEQDLRDHFYAHSEIESIKMVLQRACAFVIYTTREGAEQVAEELSNKLVIEGLRLKLM